MRKSASSHYTHSAAARARISEGLRKSQAEGRNSSIQPHRRKRVTAGHRMRACLCCKNLFESDGAHNRLCYRCGRADTSAGPFDIPHRVLR